MFLITQGFLGPTLISQGYVGAAIVALPSGGPSVYFDFEQYTSFGQVAVLPDWVIANPPRFGPVVEEAYLPGQPGVVVTLIGTVGASLGAGGSQTVLGEELLVGTPIGGQGVVDVGAYLKGVANTGVQLLGSGGLAYGPGNLQTVELGTVNTPSDGEGAVAIYSQLQGKPTSSIQLTGGIQNQP